MKLENNYKGFGERYITVNDIIQFKVGDIIHTGTHWSNGGEYDGSDMYNGEYTYCFECRELVGHKVDYNEIEENDEYANELYSNYGITEECSDEKEILVKEDTFKVVSVNSYGDKITEDDFKEDGYKIPVTVKVVQVR